MPLAYRISKIRHPVFDGSGALRVGGRWNSPGRPVVYCSDAFAGAILEILAHVGHPLRLPGLHHAARIGIPEDERIETVDEAALPGWDAPEPVVSRSFGDRWLAEERSAVLSVPALTAQPFGRNLLVNPVHPGARRFGVGPTVPVVWDARLFPQ